ncbi:hypothetical protein SAMN06273570_4652 [Candidatus Pantoea floridensis]|uniref:Uncharacterized protein n=2 Tax=Candidatus Pantoea floridensis TaxID=1938870 RepID=A0A286DNU7_9GAMM|nr:hypothetical protein BX596_4242 [Enterobacteriaceae bacterium JKS000233]SOD60301.1 hypothetical protein SAMN06273570_4652 [Pantoea floridensis]
MSLYSQKRGGCSHNIIFTNRTLFRHDAIEVLLQRVTMENKIRVFEALNKLYLDNAANPLLNAAIHKHSEMITEEFKRKSHFYKFIFKNNRFLVATVTASQFYINEEACFSDVKAECLKFGLVSANTISSLLTLMSVSGRIKMKVSKKDKRKMRYFLTEKGANDSISLINTMTSALDILSGKKRSHHISLDNIAQYFSRYSEIYKAGFFIINLVPDAHLFIDKDSGHMVMLNLFNIGNKPKREDCKEGALTRISRECSVSRSHLRNIFIEAEKNNMINYDPKSGEVEILDRFKKMFYTYMSYYFAFVQYGLQSE